MRFSSDFRAIARGALRGKWIIAALSAFVASLCGAGIAVSSSGVGSSGNSSSVISEDAFSGIQISDELLLMIAFALLAVGIVAWLWMIITFFIGGTVKLGYARFNLDMIDGKPVYISDLFSQFGRFGDGFCMSLLVGIFTFLWTLLFIIPGIIKQYSYAMTPYILLEKPNMSALDAITESRRVMDGNKWRLFCLRFSFIGWYLLCLLPEVISVVFAVIAVAITESAIGLVLLIPGVLVGFVGTLLVNAYQEAAYAAFYRDITASSVYIG